MMEISVKQIGEQFKAPGVSVAVARLEITVDVLGQPTQVSREVELTAAQLEKLTALHAEIIAGVQS